MEFDTFSLLTSLFLKLHYGQENTFSYCPLHPQQSSYSLASNICLLLTPIYLFIPSQTGLYRLTSPPTILKMFLQTGSFSPPPSHQLLRTLHFFKNECIYHLKLSVFSSQSWNHPLPLLDFAWLCLEFYVIPPPSKIRMNYETQVCEHLKKKKKRKEAAITGNQLPTVRASYTSIISLPFVIRL